MEWCSVTAAFITLIAAMPASADTTAVYKAKRHPVTMTVEIADNGNVRYQMSTGRTYGLVLNGVDYFITLEPTGPVVDRAADLLTAQKDVMAAFMPTLQDKDVSDGPQLVPMGQVTINGRTGEAFGYNRDKEGSTATAIFVFNENPMSLR